MSDRTVVIVEDDGILSLMIDVDLRETGFDICGIATTETGAIELARLHRPRFAVIDVRLKEGCGFAVARHLAEEYGTVVLLASGEGDLKERARSRGVSGHALLKPYDPALVSVALTLLERQLAGARVEIPDWLQRI